MRSREKRVSVTDGGNEKDKRANGPAARRDARVEGSSSKKLKLFRLLNVDAYLFIEDGSRSLVGGRQRRWIRKLRRMKGKKEGRRRIVKLTIRRALHVFTTASRSL